MDRAPLTVPTVVADAAALADEAGFDAVTLSAVARRLGVRTPSLYAHVRDLSALLDGVAVLALGELAAEVAGRIAGRSGRAALVGFAEAQRTYARRAPGRWQSLQRRVGAEVAGSAAAREVAGLTGAVLLGYDLPEGERVHAVRLLGSTLNGFIHLEGVGAFDHREPAVDTSWERTLDALDALFTSWPGSAPA